MQQGKRLLLDEHEYTANKRQKQYNFVGICVWFLLPVEIQKLVFGFSFLVGNRYQSRALACVCKSWNAIYFSMKRERFDAYSSVSNRFAYLLFTWFKNRELLQFKFEAHVIFPFLPKSSRELFVIKMRPDLDPDGFTVYITNCIGDWSVSYEMSDRRKKQHLECTEGWKLVDTFAKQSIRYDVTDEAFIALIGKIMEGKGPAKSRFYMKFDKKYFGKENRPQIIQSIAEGALEKNMIRRVEPMDLA